jgi:peptide/nickel transport system permease protein
MWFYILKRFLLFIPTLMVITLLAFIISANAPGDPVERMMSQSSTGEAQANNFKEQQTIWRKKLGLDLPLFYFSIQALSAYDTLYKIEDSREQKAVERLCNQCGSNEWVQQFRNRVSNLQNYCSQSFTHDSALQPTIALLQIDITNLKKLYDENELKANLDSLKQRALQLNDAMCSILVNQVQQNYLQLYANKTTWKNFIPVINFHLNNQYHRWLFGDKQFSNGVLYGDFGVSYSTQQKVQLLIGERIGWSVFFALLSISLAYLISIPLGVYMAVKKDTITEKIISFLIFALPAMPSFWVATMLLMTFANPDVLAWLPASGVKPIMGFASDSSVFLKLKLMLPYLILPTVCFTYSSIAFLSRTMRVGMLDSLQQDYIRTAKAKGLSNRQVIYHAFRNSLLPIITVFANVFPAVVGGSVIIETIFTIPGMGSTIFQAIGNQDYPVIIAVFTLTGIATMIGYLVSDILYTLADARIKFS